MNGFNGLRAVEAGSPLTCGARYLRQPTLVFHALERMEMLEPELMRGVRCDLLSYALAYSDVFMLDWSPDDKYIASASNDNTVQIWQPSP